MTIRDLLGKNTEAIEEKVREHYFSLEPWQRGALVIVLTILLIFTIYWLTKENNNKLGWREEAKREALEERLLKKMQLLKDLRG